MILAALLPGLRGQGHAQTRKGIWLGAWLAVLVTIINFWLLRTLIQSLSRFGEKLEAIVSVLAVIILLIVTNWVFHQNLGPDWVLGRHDHGEFHRSDRSPVSDGWLDIGASDSKCAWAGLWLGLYPSWEGLLIPPLALVYVAPTLITEVMGNVSGGMRQGAIFDGVLNMGLDIDLERLTNWWTGGSIHVNSLWGSFSVAPWWTIQPDFQYIWTPSAQNGSNNAAVIGIRTVVTF